MRLEDEPSGSWWPAQLMVQPGACVGRCWADPSLNARPGTWEPRTEAGHGQKGREAHPPAPSTQGWDDASQTLPETRLNLPSEWPQAPGGDTRGRPSQRRAQLPQAVQPWGQRTRRVAGPLLLFRLERRFIPIPTWVSTNLRLWSLTWLTLSG